VRPGTPARLEFLGSQGTIVIEADRIVTWEVPGEPAPAIAPQASEVAKAAADPRTFGTEGHQLQIQEMVRVVTGGEQPAVDGQEGRRTLELVLAIYQAARTGATVELPLRA